MTHIRTLATVLFLSLLAAACSGASKASTAPTSTAAPPTSISTTAPPTTAGPQTGRAQGAVLQAADFPAGWQALTPEDGGGLNLDTVWSEITRCLGVAPAAQPSGIATSPTYVRGLATQARSTVEYGSQPTADAVAAALAGPKFQGCATDAFNADVKRSAPEGAVPGPAAVAPLNVAPVTPKSDSFRITATLSLDELKVPLFQDFLVMFKGGTMIRMLFLNPGSEFPQDLEKSLVQKVVARA